MSKGRNGRKHNELGAFWSPIYKGLITIGTRGLGLGLGQWGLGLGLGLSQWGLGLGLGLGCEDLDSDLDSDREDSTTSLLAG